MKMGRSSVLLNPAAGIPPDEIAPTGFVILLREFGAPPRSGKSRELDWMQ
jgi:hypothetical protein